MGRKVELDVPCGGAIMARRSFFCWSPPEEFSGRGYEQAALQAVAFLQRVYGFVVVDYSFQGVVMYSRLARDAVSVAATAAENLSRVAIERQDLAVQSEYLTKKVSLLNFLI